MAENHFFGTSPWESPEVQGLGRLPMRAPLLPWPDSEDARRAARLGPSGPAPSNPWVLPLDGEWPFAFAENPGAAPGGFHDPSFDDSGWAKLRVPLTWALQGYDKPHYTNVVMPFGNTPPAAPAAHNPTGLYRRAFDLPAAWKERRVVLHVGGAESFLEAWCNGEYLGFSKDTRLPSEFDLSGRVRPGRNLLAFRVIRYSDSSFIEDQDQWWYGGIYRSVYLYSTDRAYIADVEARPETAAEAAGGSVEAVVRLGFLRDPSAGIQAPGSAPTDYPRDGGLPLPQGDWLVRACLFGPRVRGPGGPDASPEDPLATAEAAVGPLYRQSRWEARLSLPVKAPVPWSDENPALYCLVVSLVSPEGKELEHAALRVGFRSVEVRDRKLLINGRRVMIRGVNRHEHDEASGKTLDLAGMLRDIELLKRSNFNAVRLSHYPNDERWYELCDEFGLYLVDEANIESHAYYDHLCRDPRWAPAFLERGSRMVIRDRNRPSVILWSLGNESGYGPNHDALAGWIRSADPTRPLHYEGCMRPEWGQPWSDLESVKRGARATDIVSTMYPPLSLLDNWARTTQDRRPFIMCEYSHAMGNSNGGLADYWALIESREGLQGGFIWDWVDQGLEAFDESGSKYWKYGGDFGDEPSDLDFVCNGLVFPDRTPKPALAEAAWLFRPATAFSEHPLTGRVRIRNRRHFTDLSDVLLTWRIEAGGKELLAGRLPLPDIRPGAEAEIDLALPWTDEAREAVSRTEAFLLLEFVLGRPQAWAIAGHRLGWEQVLLSPERRAPAWLAPEQIAVPGNTRTGDAPGWSESSGGWAAQGGLPGRASWEAYVSPEGFLAELSVGGLPILASPLAMNLWRAPTENDGLKLFQDKRGIPDFSFYYENKAMYLWLDAGLDALSFSSPSAKLNSSGGTLRIEHRVSTRTGRRAGRLIQTLSLENSGVFADILFDLDPGLPELPKIGLACELAPGFERVHWFGRGPQECYPDRKAGAAVGLWEAAVDDLAVPYILPQENGNRTDIRWLEIASPETGLRVEGDRLFDFTASHHETAQLWKAAHTKDLVRRRETFLCLDAVQRGLGTAACGPDTLLRYRIQPGPVRLGLHLLPFRVEEGRPRG